MLRDKTGHQCWLIAIEGPDRVGKATQAKLLEEALAKLGYRVVTEEIPYKDGVTYSEIYRMLKDGGASALPLVFQTLQIVNRRYFQSNYLKTLVQHHDVMILDRWTLSTIVYGEAAGISRSTTEGLIQGLVEPDLTLVLDAPPWPKDNLDVLEADMAFQNRVRNLYGTMGTDKVKVIDASHDRRIVHGDILRQIFGIGIIGHPSRKKP